ncbi:rRNA maturation RNase YbeY [Hippea alviniae]|uniref:rRNA maturation RNase YbeY n=1 Tax=Hippea alviniae TaxID=1279027 RepID=UPI0003B795C5|nr:rRNA maturation RNase YbeY [Hippea alviniae]
MNLTLIEHKVSAFYNSETIKRFVEFLFDSFGVDKSKEFNILFCDDDEIRDLNKEFRGKDAPTNVLSFYGYDGNVFGDIAISLDTIEKEAKEKNQDPFEYMLFIIAHGFLHLLGYTHETMEKFDKMMKMQSELVEEFLKKESQDEEASS